MEKLIINCDKCGKELSKKDSGYYEFHYKNMISNITFKWSHLNNDISASQHLCLECFNKYLELK